LELEPLPEFGLHPVLEVTHEGDHHEEAVGVVASLGLAVLYKNTFPEMGYAKDVDETCHNVILRGSLCTVGTVLNFSVYRKSLHLVP
jgi:hypothetical protein